MKLPSFETFKETAILRAFSLLRIPLIFFLSPQVVELTPRRVECRIPLTRRAKNHLGSMYFGGLCIGADLACGLLAMKLIRESGQKVNFIFKDFEAQFLKRAEGDVHFICEEGVAIQDRVKRTLSTGERENQTLRVFAKVPKRDPNTVVAEFKLTISLKLATSGSGKPKNDGPGKA